MTAMDDEFQAVYKVGV